MAGQIDDHQIETSQTGLKDRAHRLGRDGLHLSAVEGEQGQPGDGGQRGLKRGEADPALPGDQVGPAGSVGLLLPEQQIQAAAERVGVDEEGAEALPGGAHRQRGGQYAGARSTTSAGDAHHVPRPGRRLHDVGELVDEPALRRGQFQHGLGTDGDTFSPGVRIFGNAGDQEDAGSGWGPGGGQGVGQVAADDDQRCPVPVGPGMCGRMHDVKLGSGRGGDAEQVVQQVVVLGDDQRTVQGCLPEVGRPTFRQGTPRRSHRTTFCGEPGQVRHHLGTAAPWRITP